MNRILSLVLILSLFLIVSIIYSCQAGEESSGVTSKKVAMNAFVGDQAYRSCHAGQFVSWKGSHHDYAMKVATDSTVRGDFGDSTFNPPRGKLPVLPRDSLFMVEAPGPDGERRQYQITNTFGWTPLQQYLVDFGAGKLQALNIAWDTERRRWFAMNPEEDIDHGDWLHWTGGAMNWNTMCADCHSTNLQQNYIAAADSFHTAWSSINVSCEACHGPGAEHAGFMTTEAAAQATIERIRADLRLTGASTQQQQISQCAQCHSLREELTGNYRHSGDFLDHYSPTLPHPPAYFADGQIKEEVYVYGSFLQSRMGINHDPHSLQLKANVSDNSLCLQCHASSYNTKEHHFHQPNTEASQCITCHMPGRYYMEVDFRRDHKFRVPRPDLSAKFDTPNACNDCHQDRSAECAADAIEQWYGPERVDRYSEVLAKADSLGVDALPDLKQLITDTTEPAIARATATWYLGQFPPRQSRDLLQKTLSDRSPLVRLSAARAMDNLPHQVKQRMLQDGLDDSIRAVRIAASSGLAEFTVADISFNLMQPFTDALSEYRQYLDANRYFPQGQMNRGQFFEKRGEQQKVIEAYQEALEQDPQFNPARINLAYLYNSRGDNGWAEQLLREVDWAGTGIRSGPLLARPAGGRGRTPERGPVLF